MTTVTTIQQASDTDREIEHDMERFRILSDIIDYANQHGHSAAHTLIDDAAMRLSDQWINDMTAHARRQIASVMEMLAGSNLHTAFVAGLGAR